MRPDRHAHALQHRHVLGDRAVVDRHARIVDDVVHHAERVGLRHPAVVVDRARPVPIAGGIDLVDGDDLAGLRLLDHVVVVEAPPRRGIAAEGLAGIGGVAARARRDVEDLDLEHVARLGAAHEDRPGQDVDAEPLAGATAVHGCVHRPGAAPVDAFAFGIPAEHALGTGIAHDHALGIVVGVVGERLQRHQVARVDVEARLLALAEIAPVHGVLVGRQDVMRRALRHLLAGILGGGVAGEQRTERKGAGSAHADLTTLHDGVSPRSCGRWCPEPKIRNSHAGASRREEAAVRSA